MSCHVFWRMCAISRAFKKYATLYNSIDNIFLVNTLYVKKILLASAYGLSIVVYDTYI